MKANKSNAKCSPRILFIFLVMFCFGANVFTAARNGIDPTFNAVDSYITEGTRVAIQPDGKILLVGKVNVNGVAKNIIVRLNADGSRDASFNRNGSGVGGNGTINFIKLQADGKIIIAGNFSSFNGVPRNRLARLNSDGTVDMSFQNTDFNGGNISNVEIQSGGKILINGTVDIIRLNTDGSNDSTFNFIGGQSIEKWTLLPNDKIVVVQITGKGIRVTRRFNSDGSLDVVYNTNAVAFALRGQPDGKLLIGGTNLMPAEIFRFNADGFRDLTFATNNIGFAPKIDLTPDNKILVNRSNSPNLIRLLTNGTVDTTFNAASVLAAIYDFAIQPDGKIIVTGSPVAVSPPATPRVIFRLNPDGSTDNSFNATLAFNSASTPFDFDGDGKTDISVFRGGVWYLQRSQLGFAAVGWGVASDKIAPADFDGDGKTDLTVYRPSNGEWSVLRSLDNTIFIIRFGAPEDLPRPADFDGDGKADICVFRPSNGVWYRLNSSSGQFAATAFGQSGDVPLIADFDGDGKADISVFRPSNGVWYWLRSSDNQFAAVQFGANGDKPVAADYDGDGKTDISVFRPSNGVWYRLNSRDNSFYAVQFGQAGDVPTLGDYDGDGRANIAVFRPSNGVWYRLNSTNGSFYFELFGASNDRPIPAAFVP